MWRLEKLREGLIGADTTSLGLAGGGASSLDSGCTCSVCPWVGASG